jgi:hypothetical protein
LDGQDKKRRRFERFPLKKEVNMTLTPAKNCREETRKETKIQPSVIDHITHDIVNQLSVISLCCCELRHSVGEKLESDQLKEFKRIENAVQNAADMIKQLKAVVQDHGHTRTDRSLESALNRAEAGDNFYAALSRFLLRR